ncbi:hypothetical protein COI51_19670 [Bacillus toyonensis]|jgi:DNA-binding transcriptional regulator YiaG|uniref:helix-turn-helix domain-containing protein n=1 Tax=Bacillus toyonensis TaxID=155322 RepID=UPI000BEF8C1B|nr:helix-turn-helix transcriptional regulator [Bacillus toyonensis]PEM21297.1 hypothetical protein CN616_06000 [Bacillus toyonensis]PGA10774.1 hypothetical protein COL67_04415 [Bacillus toyonensis]PGA47640.1 hypothetical protein COL85_03275 [Bacillus toyonensis]PGB28965.1 hypothetical protein COM06_05405 [Bacillus toyonensis]PGB34790.1 hypothetical protein COM07_26090 [Bacillus toyonensis]
MIGIGINSLPYVPTVTPAMLPYIRTRIGLTRQELAARIGINLDEFYEYEKGSKLFSPNVHSRLLAVLSEKGVSQIEMDVYKKLTGGIN